MRILRALLLLPLVPAIVSAQSSGPVAVTYVFDLQTRFGTTITMKLIPAKNGQFTVTGSVSSNKKAKVSGTVSKSGVLRAKARIPGSKITGRKEGDQFGRLGDHQMFTEGLANEGVVINGEWRGGKLVLTGYAFDISDSYRPVKVNAEGVRKPLPPKEKAPANLAGTWEIQRNGRWLACSITQSGKTLSFTNERGGTSPGEFVTPRQVRAKNWEGGLLGTVGKDTISWGNGTTWRRRKS